MRLILLRHGETDWNRAARIQGIQPVCLNETGVRQMEQTCRVLRASYGQGIAGIVTSPLLRARQSAEICASQLHLSVTVMDELRERSFGQLEGRTKQAIRDLYQIADVELLEGTDFNIESSAEVMERLRRGLCTLHSHFHGGTVLVVTHGSIIRLLARSHAIDVDIIPNADFIEVTVP